MRLDQVDAKDGSPPVASHYPRDRSFARAAERGDGGGRRPDSLSWRFPGGRTSVSRATRFDQVEPRDGSPPVANPYPVDRNSGSILREGEQGGRGGGRKEGGRAARFSPSHASLYPSYDTSTSSRSGRGDSGDSRGRGSGGVRPEDNVPSGGIGFRTFSKTPRQSWIDHEREEQRRQRRQQHQHQHQRDNQKHQQYRQQQQQRQEQEQQRLRDQQLRQRQRQQLEEEEEKKQQRQQQLEHRQQLQRQLEEQRQQAQPRQQKQPRQQLPPPPGLGPAPAYSSGRRLEEAEGGVETDESAPDPRNVQALLGGRLSHERSSSLGSGDVPDDFSVSGSWSGGDDDESGSVITGSSDSRRWAGGKKPGEGGGAYSFVDCLNSLTIDHASRSRRGKK